MDIVEKLVHTLIQQNKTICTAESCTGGLIGAHITDISGASRIFTHGFITYGNNAKESMIGVSQQTLITYGAVSPETAQEMADGALLRAESDIAIACTGIAGPDGGTPEKPVGLVYIGIAHTGHQTKVYKHTYKGTRQEIRTQTVIDALTYAVGALKK